MKTTNKKVMKKTITKGKSKNMVGKIVAGAAAVGAVGAGMYYLLGPEAKAHQKKAVSLMSKMEKEVNKQVSRAKELSKPLYHKMVNAVASEYATQYKAHEKDINKFSKKLKSDWDLVAKKFI